MFHVILSLRVKSFGNGVSHLPFDGFYKTTFL